MYATISYLWYEQTTFYNDITAWHYGVNHCVRDSPSPTDTVTLCDRIITTCIQRKTIYDQQWLKLNGH